jgi:hypothetical protein
VTGQAAPNKVGARRALTRLSNLVGVSRVRTSLDASELEVKPRQCFYLQHLTVITKASHA